MCGSDYLCPLHQLVIRRILHTIFSLWLAALLLFGVTPKEAMHACGTHKDTVHRHDVGGPVAESQHHHCSFLGFHLMPFSGPSELRIPLATCLPMPLSAMPAPDERAAQQAIALREGRGPPFLS